MKVITLNSIDLEDKAFSLASMILKDQWEADLIIGIATGGVFVSRPMKTRFIENGWDGEYFEMKLSRQSTEAKKKLKVKIFLTKLPYFIPNQLRKLEMFISESFKAGEYDPSKEKRVVLSDDLINGIKSSNSILLVDDAIDTGSTILAIKHVIRRLNPSIDIKVAVLTVTHKKPYIEPDYTLYKRILLRCPWAEDYKGRDKIG